MGHWIFIIPCLGIDTINKVWLKEGEKMMDYWKEVKLGFTLYIIGLWIFYFMMVNWGMSNQIIWFPISITIVLIGGYINLRRPIS